VKIARLVLFFTISFIVLFVLAALVRFLQIRIDVVRILPLQAETMLPELISAAKWALSFTIYASLLLTVSYAARNRVSIPLTIIFLVILAGGFCLGLSLGIERSSFIPGVRDTGKTLTGPGLILSRQDTTIVLLNGRPDSQGPRVVSIADNALIYQEIPSGPDNSLPSLPPAPFRTESPWLLRSIALDIQLSSQQLNSRLSAGIIPFLIYILPLIFFLSSLSFVLRLSSWPLANLFIGALVFRGILALETFINTPEVQSIFQPFIQNRLPLSWSVPLIFCAFALLINLYTLLVFLAKRRSDED
jgi:hypothetical protein